MDNPKQGTRQSTTNSPGVVAQHITREAVCAYLKERLSDYVLHGLPTGAIHQEVQYHLSAIQDKGYSVLPGQMAAQRRDVVFTAVDVLARTERSEEAESPTNAQVRAIPCAKWKALPEHRKMVLHGHTYLLHYVGGVCACSERVYIESTDPVEINGYHVKQVTGPASDIEHTWSHYDNITEAEARIQRAEPPERGHNKVHCELLVSGVGWVFLRYDVGYQETVSIRREVELFATHAATHPEQYAPVHAQVAKDITTRGVSFS